MTAPAVASPRVVTITLPLPPSCLSPRARSPWRERAAATRECRRTAYFAGLAAAFPARASFAGEHFPQATVAIRYVVCRANPLGLRGRAQPTDLDSVQSVCKAYLDGALVDSGILLDDSARYLTGISTTLNVHGRGGGDCPRVCRGSLITLTVTEVLP